jgi:hypothetical protein
MLNLHNLTEEVANTQTERAGRMGEVRPLGCVTCPSIHCCNRYKLCYHMCYMAQDAQRKQTRCNKRCLAASSLLVPPRHASAKRPSCSDLQLGHHVLQCSSDVTPL